MTKQDVTRPFWLGLTAGAAITITAGALFFASSESVLRSSFQTALAKRTDKVAAPVKQVASANTTAPISGSEDFWLSAVKDGSKPVNQPISVGDQISLNVGGVHRTLEVATVSDVAPQITQIDTSAAPSHLILVTAHDPNDSTSRPVRFVMEIQQNGMPVIAGRSGRTL